MLWHRLLERGRRPSLADYVRGPEGHLGGNRRRSVLMSTILFTWDRRRSYFQRTVPILRGSPKAPA